MVSNQSADWIWVQVWIRGTQGATQLRVVSAEAPVPAQILNLTQDKSCPQLQPERLLPAVDIRQWRCWSKFWEEAECSTLYVMSLSTPPRPTPSPILLCLKKYLARGGWRDVSEMSEFSEMLPSGHVKANAVMNSHQLYLPAKHPYKAKPTKLSLRWGRRCLNHSPYWGTISSW